MTNISQKDLAVVLDRAAARADRSAASSKQVWFLAGLIMKADALDRANAESEYNDYLLNQNYRLTKREASSMIDFYLDMNARADA